MTRRRGPPIPPRPDLVRRPAAAFGWLDASLLHDGSLARLGPHAVAVLVLLALAADRRGASYYGRARMAERLGVTRAEVDAALDRLLELGFVELRPWRPGGADGVWQLMPVPQDSNREPPRTRRPTSAAEMLRQLGFGPPET